MNKKVLAFGEVLWDILPSCMTLGGAPFNFAYRINSLGDTGLMVSRLGRDELGQNAFQQVVKLGLDTTHIQWDDHFPTGTVQVSFDEQNNPDYHIVPEVAYDRIEATNGLLKVASSADCLCFGTLAQRSKKSRRTVEQLLEQASNGLKLLDINLRKDCYNLETVTFSLQKADVLKLNEQEAHQLGGMLSLAHKNLFDLCQKMLQKWALQLCLVTLGNKGALGMSADGKKTYTPGYKVEVADSLGSGDAFTAGFVHKILRGESLAVACEFGNILGAIVATQTGATAPVEQKAIDKFLSRDIERIVHPEFDDSQRDQ